MTYKTNIKFGYHNFIVQQAYTKVNGIFLLFYKSITKTQINGLKLSAYTKLIGQKQTNILLVKTKITESLWQLINLYYILILIS